MDVSFVQSISNNNSEAFKWCYLAVVVLLIFLSFWCISKSYQKIDKIVDPKSNYSYCSISVTIVKTIIANFILLIIGLLVQVYMILSDKHYPKEVSERPPIFWVFFALVWVVGGTVNNLIVLTQKYEWACILHIIIFQKGKTLGEITYLMNNAETIK